MSEDAKATALLESFARDVVGRATADGPLLLDQILPQVYGEFRSLAAYLMRGERNDHTLRPTALANEAYLRLAGQAHARLDSKEHVLSLAATMMRRVLVDYARARGAAKRGGDQLRITLDEHLQQDVSQEPGASAKQPDLLDLHRAMERLGELSERKVKVVELIYFGGLSFEEAAQALHVSKRTVVRDWRSAKAWLWNELVGAS